ncbi:hypothetical protein Tco_1219184 [Tanacetum coccineum]
MASTEASSSNPSKKIKLTIIPPRQLFVDLTSEEYDTTTPSPITKSSSPSPPNASSKTPSTKDTSSTFGTTSSSFKSKPQSLPPFLDDIMDAPPRSSNPLPLQSHTSLDITLFLSPITPLYHILDTPSPPSPQPPPQPRLMGHPIYFNMFDYHGASSRTLGKRQYANMIWLSQRWDRPWGYSKTTAITSTEDLQRATFTTPPQTAPGTNTTEPPPPPIRNKGPETEVSHAHQKERRGKDNRRPPVFGRIGKQVSGTQTANLQNLDTHENNDWRISVRDRLGSRDVHSRLGQRRSPSESPPSSDSEDSRRKRRRRVSSSSEDTSDNEDAETGHWKSKNKYRGDEDEDMSRPWRRQKVDAFTRRISDFSEDKKRRMPANVKTYDGTNETRGTGSAKLPRRSIDGFEELRRAFRLNFTQRKKCAKNPVELARVKQRQGESTSTYVERYKDECITRWPNPLMSDENAQGLIQGEALRRGQQKRTQTTGPGSVQEDNPMTQRDTRTDGANFPTTTNAHLEEQAWGRILHGSEKLSKKSVKNFRMEVASLFPLFGGQRSLVEPLTIEINAAGHEINCLYIDGGAFADILYEHCFQRLRPEVKRALHNRLDEFYGDQITIAHTRHYWKTRDLSDTRGPIHGPRDAKNSTSDSARIVTILQTTTHRLRNAIQSHVTDADSRDSTQPKCKFEVAISSDYPDQRSMVDRGVVSDRVGRLCGTLAKKLDISHGNQ